jgi:1-acyl-sn-glycerol-3-phosphate acyltransferase
MPELPPFPLRVVLGVAWAVLKDRKRSLREDALSCTSRLPIKVRGREHVPHDRPGVVVVNHYYRPGFSGVWVGLALSAVIPEELVWVMSAAWTEADTIWSRLKAAASVPILPRLARVYDLISMPPMPPRPHQTMARARAVRQILAAARQRPAPLLAIAPEGQDPPNGVLMRPPSGAGRMLYKLAQVGCQFYPVGIYEQGKEMVTDFGPCFQLILPEGLSRDEIECLAADRVMRAIAEQLPPGLRGEYA